MRIALPFVHALQGQTLSHVWRGYGSAVFLEFGRLHPRTRHDGTAAQPQGDLTLMIEWSWRVERPRSILIGSWSANRRWPRVFERMRGTTVTDVGFQGLLPEIAVVLSNGLRVVSFMTAEGQPAWALCARHPALGCLDVKRGRFHVEPAVVDSR